MIVGFSGLVSWFGGMVVCLFCFVLFACFFVWFGWWVAIAFGYLFVLWLFDCVVRCMCSLGFMGLLGITLLLGWVVCWLWWWFECWGLWIRFVRGVGLGGWRLVWLFDFICGCGLFCWLWFVVCVWLFVCCDCLCAWCVFISLYVDGYYEGCCVVWVGVMSGLLFVCLLIMIV